MDLGRGGDQVFRYRCVIVAAMLVAVGCSFFGGGDERYGSISPDEVGDDPFVDDAGEAAPPELEDIIDDFLDAAGDAESDIVGEGDAALDPGAVREIRLDAIEEVAIEADLRIIRPRSPGGSGLYGGSGTDEVCDVAAIINFLKVNPVKLQAWADVFGVTPEQALDYIEDLTPGYLVDDTRVVNHTFEDGKAVPFEATLKAGTAVLADRDGVVRVRCKCGNPLKRAVVALDDRTIEQEAFADEVVDYQPGPGVEKANDPETAVGAPDCDDTNRCKGEQVVSIGEAAEPCEFFLTLRFVDNVLVNGPGDDLRIIEIGEVEGSEVYVGNSVDDLQLVGSILGGDASIDLSPAVEEGERFTVVRICDDPATIESSSPGADIDAVAALNWDFPE